MKILQISPSFYPAISIGGPIFSTLTFTEILEKNHQITTLTTQQGLDKVQLKSVTYNSEIKLSNNHTKIYKKFIGPPNFTFSFSLLFLVNPEFQKLRFICFARHLELPIYDELFLC